MTNFREVKSRWKNEMACRDMDKEETEIKKQLNYTIKEVSRSSFMIPLEDRFRHDEMGNYGGGRVQSQGTWSIRGPE